MNINWFSDVFQSELEKEMISAALFDERIKNDIFDLTKTDLEISICWAKVFIRLFFYIKSNNKMTK